MSFANFRRHTASTLPSIPFLWTEARRLFARAIANTGEAAEIAQHTQLSPSRRRDIVLWIEPVERMVRGLILARAAIHLLMTPEGRKLLRESKRDYPPPQPEEDRETEPPKPPGAAVRSLRIPHPGWHTIWQPPPRPAPVDTTPPHPEETETPGLGDPASWSCPYRIVGRMPVQSWTVCAPEPARRPRITLLDTEWITPPKPKPLAPPPQTVSVGEDHTRDHAHIALRYARRIEALRRVIESPEPTIRRLARVLARLAPDDLDLPRWRTEAARRRWHCWRQGDLYADQCREHAMLGLRALHLSLEWLDRPDIEPG